jgi:hypothetical protein
MPVLLSESKQEADCVRNNGFHLILTLSPPAVKTQCLSVPGVPAPCEKFPHSSQLNFE